MDWMQFLNGIVSSLAWPSVAIAALIVFRFELSKLIQRLAHLKYGDFEADFGKMRDQAAELHEGVGREPLASKDPAFRSFEEQVLEAVERAPSAAILLAWSSVETAMVSAVARLQIPSPFPPSRSPMYNMELLTRQADLPPKYSSLLNQMRMLRNRIAHEPDATIAVTEAQALDYARTAMDMVGYLGRLQGKG